MMGRLGLWGGAHRALAALFAAAIGAAAPALAAAQTPLFDTIAPHAIVIDAETGAVLLAKNAEEPIPPASMSKLMTAELIFHGLTTGRLKLDDRLPVSAAAFRKGGSMMFLRRTDEPRIEDLLRGVIVQSGNDASIALAEGHSGSEDAFAAAMNARAEQLGLRDSSFANATGLPDERHRMSVRDLARLAAHIIEVYPEFYKIYAERRFTWDGVDQPNRNPVLDVVRGGDGMKTGFTDEAGYGLVGAAKREGRRVIAVLAGLESAEARKREIRRVMEWAFRAFETATLAKAGQIVGEAEVWLGDAPAAPLALKEDLRVILPRGDAGELTATIHYEGPVTAPIAAGDPIGALRLTRGETLVLERPLVAAADVGPGGYQVRLSAGIAFLVRWITEQSRAPEGRAAVSLAPGAGAEAQ